MSYEETRKCHHCHRQSWYVANGEKCPHCGRRTGKYHKLELWIISAFAVLALIGLSWMAFRA